MTLRIHRAGRDRWAQPGNMTMGQRLATHGAVLPMAQPRPSLLRRLFGRAGA